MHCRVCKHCSRTSEEVTFPKDSGYADGISRLCSDCRNAYARGEWRPDRSIQVDRIGERHCVKCNRTPLEVTFLKCTSNRDGLDNICVECASIRDSDYMRRYYATQPSAIRENLSKRQIRLRDAWVEHVDANIVFERDGWVCQICGNGVDATLRGPDPLSPSLDHRIPLARGGTHEYTNVQLSHLKCNLRKNSK